MEEIISSLRTLQAATMQVGLTAQVFHWNVTGRTFQQDHDFFGDYYENVNATFDTVAEYIKIFNGQPVISLPEVISLFDMPDSNTTTDRDQMFSRLARVNRALADKVQQVKKECETVGAPVAGLENWLDERLDWHEKMAWMIRSHF